MIIHKSREVQKPYGSPTRCSGWYTSPERYRKPYATVRKRCRYKTTIQTRLEVQQNFSWREFETKANITGEEKVFERLPTNPTVEDFFKLYITEEMIDYLMVQTNLYARQFLDKEPRLPMYWYTDSILAMPIFNQVMRRDRFLLLVIFFHFADNTKYNLADLDRDKLYKIREVINMIKDRCDKVYSTGKLLSMMRALCYSRED